MAKDEDLSGLVKVIRKGNLICSGTRVDRVTIHGDVVLEGFDFKDLYADLREFRKTRKPHLPPQRKRTKQPARDVRTERKYIVMPAEYNYAQGVQALQEACKEDEYSLQPKIFVGGFGDVHRPLSFKEMVEVKLIDFNTLKDENGALRSIDDRLRLFREKIYTSSGIVCKANSTKYKIIQKCDKLITIPNNFCKDGLPVRYADFNVPELDFDNDFYSKFSTKKQAKEHQGLFSLIEDQSLFKKYLDLTFNLLKNRHKLDTGMAFYLHEGIQEHDELRPVSIGNLSMGSNVYGGDSFSNKNPFLRVTRR